jgi:hypothetical protein
MSLCPSPPRLGTLSSLNSKTRPAVFAHPRPIAARFATRDRFGVRLLPQRVVVTTKTNNGVRPRTSMSSPAAQRRRLVRLVSRSEPRAIGASRKGRRNARSLPNSAAKRATTLPQSTSVPVLGGESGSRIATQSESFRSNTPADTPWTNPLVGISANTG